MAEDKKKRWKHPRQGSQSKLGRRRKRKRKRRRRRRRKRRPGIGPDSFVNRIPSALSRGDAVQSSAGQRRAEECNTAVLTRKDERNGKGEEPRNN